MDLLNSGPKYDAKALAAIDWLEEALGDALYNIIAPMDATPRTTERLFMLLRVVRHLGPLRSDALLAILQRHVFEDEEVRRDSVVSALKQSKYSLEILFQIADTAKGEFIVQWRSAAPKVSTDRQNT